MSGVSADAGNPDLSALFEGGEAFLQRMRDLKDAKAAYDASYEALKIGNDAKAALDDAQHRVAEAEARLKEANEQAAEIVAQAQAEAKRLVDEATVQASQVTSDTTHSREVALVDLERTIESAKRDLDAWVAETKKSIAAEYQAAQAARSDADQIKATMEQRFATLDAEKKAAAELMTKAKAMEAEFAAKLAKMNQLAAS